MYIAHDTTNLTEPKQNYNMKQEWNDKTNP